MTNLRVRDITQALKRKGMKPARPGDHSRFIRTTPTGFKITTMVSHGARTIDDTLIGTMARQCNLTKAQFLDLVECPLSQEDWDAEIARRDAEGTLFTRGR